MSNFKHIIPKKTYLERGQAKHRLHLGELEKKVDYDKRKEIYHKKKKIERILKEKLMTKNPDEFHTGMVHAKIQDDGYLVKEEKKLKPEVRTKYRRNSLKEKSHWLYVKLKKINKKINNYQMNIPLRYVYNNSHVLYSDDEEHVLKTEEKKLQKQGSILQKDFNRLLNVKKGIMDKIRKLDNDLIVSYKNSDGYRVMDDEKGRVSYRCIAPRDRKSVV